MALWRHTRSIELATRYVKTTYARILIDSGCPKHVYTDFKELRYL